MARSPLPRGSRRRRFILLPSLGDPGRVSVVFDLLTPREREVMGRVVAGLLNKQIAHVLGTSEATVKIQRQHVMLKKEAGSLADLVRMADRLGVLIPKS